MSTKDNHNPMNLFSFTESSFTEIGLISYVSAAGVVIDCEGCFKSALLELFIKNLSLPSRVWLSG